MRLITLFSAASLPLVAATASAHHSWSAEYDTRSSIVVAGVVSEFLGRRPHPSMAFDVRSEDGTLERWTAEWNGNFMDESGEFHSPELFGAGESITITGQPHRDEDRRFVRIRSVVRDADGTVFESRRGGDGRSRDARRRR